jgi:hypothetical protein
MDGATRCDAAASPSTPILEPASPLTRVAVLAPSGEDRSLIAVHGERIRAAIVIPGERRRSPAPAMSDSCLAARDDAAGDASPELAYHHSLCAPPPDPTDFAIFVSGALIPPFRKMFGANR